MSYPNDPPMPTSAAMAVFDRISRTTEEFAKRIARTPLIPEHRMGIQARVQAASDMQTVSYTPYTRFQPRRSNNLNVNSTNTTQLSSQSTQDPSGSNSSEGAPPSFPPGSPSGDASDTENYLSAYSRPSSRARTRDSDDPNAGRTRNIRSISPRERRPLSRRLRSPTHSQGPVMPGALPHSPTSAMQVDSPLIPPSASGTSSGSVAPANAVLVSQGTGASMHADPLRPVPAPPPATPGVSQGTGASMHANPLRPVPAPPPATPGVSQGTGASMHADPLRPVPAPPAIPGVSQRTGASMHADPPPSVPALPPATPRMPQGSGAPMHAIPPPLPARPTAPGVSRGTSAPMHAGPSSSLLSPPPVTPLRRIITPMRAGFPPSVPAMPRVSQENGVPMDEDAPPFTPVPLPVTPDVSQVPMDEDSPSPAAPPPVTPGMTTSPSGGLPASSRPLPLPPASAALVDVIGKAVAEHLSSGLLAPTVQNIVDACIPRLTEAIGTHLAAHNMFSFPNGSTRRNSTDRTDSNDHGFDGDDEDDDERLPPPRRKRPGPRGKMNRLHNAFRVYLRSKKIIPTKIGTEEPVSAPADTVATFNQNGESPPTLENIAIDWASNPLSASRWNREVVSILSFDFHQQIKSGSCKDVIYDENSMNLSVCHQICEKKLVRTYQIHRKQTQISKSTGNERECLISGYQAQQERRLKSERRVSRRHGTLTRRKRITTENLSRDTPTWNVVMKIIDQLGIEGMSGDETDSPPSKPKALRRLELPWLNPSISLLFNNVESYEPAFRQQNMREQIGNSSLVRHWEPRTKDWTSVPVAGLPRNWYHDDWFQGLNSGARSMLAVRKEVLIPALKPYGV